MPLTVTKYTSRLMKKERGIKGEFCAAGNTLQTTEHPTGWMTPSGYD
jgi:hypothetical protein